MGYGLEFWWLVMVNVTSRWQATEFLSHIPLRLRLALLLVRFAQPAKVRLRASHSAQNDRLVVCFAVCVRSRVAEDVDPYNKTHKIKKIKRPTAW